MAEIAPNDMETLFDRAGQLSTLLLATDLTLATAESLTGGNISAALTSFPGSSAYFMAGLTAYSNQAKIEVLKVSSEILEINGAVSYPCALAMAIGAIKMAGADLGLSTTGIAGPTGGTRKKPVGLVYIAATGPKDSLVEERIFQGNRREITLATSIAAIELMLKYLAKQSNS